MRGRAVVHGLVDDPIAKTRAQPLLERHDVARRGDVRPAPDAARPHTSAFSRGGPQAIEDQIRDAERLPERDALMQHLLAGIQYALGDLAADDSPDTARK